jgi:uncharacterized membrane protein
MHRDNESGDAAPRAYTGSTAPPEARPEFHAVLTPYRSLGPRGFLAVMAIVGTVCFIGGLAFGVMGAWPVVGFFGLDVLIVWAAFRASYRSARAYEEIRLGDGTLLIRRVTARGEASEVRLDPYWARLIVDRVEDEGVVGLAVASHGQRHEIGAFLDPDARESFARALAAALRSVKAGAVVA